MNKNIHLIKNNLSLTILLISLLGMLILTSCAQATQAPELTETGTTHETSEGTTTSREGVLKVAMQPIVQTDPAFISSDSEVLVANHVYDYLVDIDPQNNIIPRLAKEWTVSDDGLSYVFTLQEGVICGGRGVDV
jgi:peptide/nickel transport system substrate-binding protein